jgi:small subunit ribosomal protein S20
MAHSNSAKKRIRQNEANRARNRWRMTSMRTSIKDLGEKMLHGTAAEAQEAFKAACKIIDRTAAKGVIHKNQAARRKSRLAARLKAKVEAKAPAAGTKSGGKAKTTK